MIQVIDGKTFNDMIVNGAALIETHKQQINELNVFPVPDGDTGTNMSLTINSAVAELKKKAPDTVGDVAVITANALLRGARGNSGVILSLLFRGIAKVLKHHDTADTVLLAEALEEGVSAAYKAVMKPTEGTVLTVARLAAKEATDICGRVDDVEEFLDIVIEKARETLAQTIDLNPVLQKAGVVDAGGMGFICLLKGMRKALCGEMVVVDTDDTIPAENIFSEFDTDEIKYAYCTEFIVNRETYKSPEVLRDYLSGIGDSLVFVEDDDIIKVHVHTNEPGNVITQALTYGSLVTTKIENMRQQHTNMVAQENTVAAEAEDDAPAAPQKKYGIVAVCAGDGLRELFTELGVDQIVTGGQTMNPSTDDILKAVEKTPAEIVYVLPNNKNIIMAAQQCAPISSKKIVVIQSKTIPQGIAALLNMDDSLEEDELTAEMESALTGVRTALVTYAARDSVFDGLEIKANEYLALLEGSLVCSNSDFDVILKGIADSVDEYSPELVTVYYGENVTEDVATEMGRKLGNLLPDTEINVINGGQPVYYYMISVE